MASTTPAHTNHFYRAIMEANEYPGPAVVVAYTPCMPEHGIADDAATRQAKLAVDSRAFPLFTYDPRRGETMSERLSLQGNPAPRTTGRSCPTARHTTSSTSPGPRAGSRSTSSDGAPSPEIQATRDERLEYWHLLQELAGIR